MIIILVKRKFLRIYKENKNTNILRLLPRCCDWRMKMEIESRRLLYFKRGCFIQIQGYFFCIQVYYRIFSHSESAKSGLRRLIAYIFEKDKHFTYINDADCKILNEIISEISLSNWEPEKCFLKYLSTIICWKLNFIW